MLRALPRILAAGVLVVACSHTDAAARTAHTTAASTGTGSSGSAASPSVASTSVASAGAVMPHDSVSDRADRGRIMGDSTAPVWLIMASDFQCPFCKQWHDASFASIVHDFANTGRVRIAFLNMPLSSIHPHAKAAAEAAMCASVQNKFWPMHDSLFATQRIWETLQNPLSTFDTLARESGVRMPDWRQCVSHHLTLPLIDADYDRARQAGVRSTPTFFVDGKMLVGPDGQSAGAGADVHGAVDSALAKHGRK
jgi:protein-disulfide isomerase